MTPIDRGPSEAVPERIPGPDDRRHLQQLFGLVDLMHDQVHSPSGMPWVGIEIALAAIATEVEWANDARIDPRYRYRIDAPLDPHAVVPDEIPKEWET